MSHGRDAFFQIHPGQEAGVSMEMETLFSPSTLVTCPLGSRKSQLSQSGRRDGGEGAGTMASLVHQSKLVRKKGRKDCLTV